MKKWFWGLLLLVCLLSAAHAAPSPGDVANAVIKETTFHNRLLKTYIKNWPEEESAK